MGAQYDQETALVFHGMTGAGPSHLILTLSYETEFGVSQFGRPWQVMIGPWELGSVSLSQMTRSQPPTFIP